MRWFILLLSYLSLCGIESEEESLFLRRIADFWQEGEYQIAKSQMEQFVEEYPESPFSDALCAALGDLFLREKNFPNALNYYAQVKSPEFYHRVFLNRMQCLYEMQWHATLADECEAYLENGPNLHVSYFLGIALYYQCINSSKETDLLQKIAERAKPHFEMLYQSELKEEIAQGYAHLCCILKEYEKATEIYLDLAEQDAEDQEEMLFQVALIQSEYDKKLALQTFDKIASLGRERAKEAAYNRAVLAFDLGLFEDLTREDLLDQIPEDRIGTARLFIGRSLLNLGKLAQAIQELKAYVQDAPISETLYAGLLSLLDASFQCCDIESLDDAISKLQANYPDDPELPKAYFSKVHLLKRKGDIEKARSQIETLLVQFPDMGGRPQVLFELIHLDYKEKSWENCYERGKKFIAEHPSHELAPFVWRYFVSASAEIANTQPKHRKQLLKDLQAFLKIPLSEIEKDEWELLLAKTHYELQDFEAAKSVLKDQNSPNAKLLIALCYRDGQSDLKQFCLLAEEALQSGANLVQSAQIHTSLYNAYLELKETEKSAEHLFSAFMEKAPTKLENLLWLADFYFDRLSEDEGNFIIAARTAAILNKCIQDLPSENAVSKLAKVYLILGRLDDAIELLESSSENGSRLILAESYAKRGDVEKACQMFDEIVLSCGTVRSDVGAAASLQGAKLKLANPNSDISKIAKQLKDLVIQKNLETEPLHLEAALEYIELQAKNDLKKRLALLKKTKADFEGSDDLLSKDYHEARKSLAHKEKIYQNYMMFIDSEIFSALAKLEPQNKDLKAKSQDLLLKIMRGSPPTALKERVQRRIAADEP